METETSIITKVVEYDDSYGITLGSLGCGLNKSHGVTPKEGDELTVYTNGGFSIRGMYLNGVKIFYKTDDDIENERVEWLRKNEEEKQQRFIDNQKILDEKYNALPKYFKERIDKFRANNDRFRIDYESYELFCCEQALIIANACVDIKSIQKFSKKKWKDQLLQVPGLSEDHSGNTFGASCNLAYNYLLNPENVKKVIGALSTLVGSAEYGDF